MYQEKNSEIDLRSLIKTRDLKCECHNASPLSLVNDRDINLVDRNFETSRVWTKVEQTSYIESIFLQCALQPIIRFKNNNSTIIIDGYNRYMSVKDFCDNKLVLNVKGLKQLKFLAGENYDNIGSTGRDYFNKSVSITIIDYSFSESVTPDEEYEIIRYLHLIYNTGLRLEVEEIQRAQYFDDYLTSKIRNELINNGEFMDKLIALGLFNGRKQRNKIDNILLNCRLLLASTYSSVNSFCSTYNIEDRIEKNYLPNLVNLNLDKVYQDFFLNVSDIYENLINTQKWNVYTILHTKPFLDATYWLVSIIRKDNLYNINFMDYLEYFGCREEQEKNFDPHQAHYKKNMYNRYFVVSKYYQEKYGIDMSCYFNGDSLNSENCFTINSLQELSNNHFTFREDRMKISNLIYDLENSNYNLKPYYQRQEIMNSSVSSKIIESILLGIRIPFVLACDVYDKKNNSYVTEIIDGQQRLLSILGFLQKPFKNEDGYLEYSNKNGYALKDLRILYELNNLKVGPYDRKGTMKKEDVDKIYDSYIYFYKTKEGNGAGFNAVDHFIRLNKNNYTIKDHTYRMWNLTTDRKIIEYEKEITKKYVGTILPNINSKRTSNMITIKLACLFYHEDFYNINMTSYNNRRITSWLNEFNVKKQMYMFKESEKISELREKYINSLNEVKYFYEKINDFLISNDKNIKDLIAVDGRASIPNTSYYYLFCMLGNFSRNDIINNSQKIYDIIKEFFRTIKLNKLNSSDRIECLNFTIQKLMIYNSSSKYEKEDKRRYEFMEKMEKALNK